MNYNPFSNNDLSRRSVRGFTLIELLVVISIIGMLSSVVLVSLQGARDKGKIGAGQNFDDHTYHAFGAAAVATWSFDEGSGASAADTSGNLNTLTLTGVGWNTNTNSFRGASSLNFPATASYGISSSNKFSKTNGSFSFWIYPRSTVSTQEVLWTNSGDGANNGFSTQISFAGSFVRVAIFGGGSLNLLSNTSINQSLNKWSHVLVSWNGSNVKIYINGKLDTESNSYISTYTLGNLKVGREYGGNPDYRLDELRIYTQSLQTAEVERLYAEGLPTHTLAEAR